jgi:hypothetical protein
VRPKLRCDEFEGLLQFLQVYFLSLFLCMTIPGLCLYLGEVLQSNACVDRLRLNKRDKMRRATLGGSAERECTYRRASQSLRVRLLQTTCLEVIVVVGRNRGASFVRSQFQGLRFN